MSQVWMQCNGSGETGSNKNGNSETGSRQTGSRCRDDRSLKNGSHSLSRNCPPIGWRWRSLGDTLTGSSYFYRKRLLSPEVVLLARRVGSESPGCAASGLAINPGFSIAAAVACRLPDCGRTRTRVGGFAGEAIDGGFGSGAGDSVEVTSVEVVWLLGTSVAARSSSDVTELRREEKAEAAVKSIELFRDRGSGDLRTTAPVKSTTSAPIESPSPVPAFKPEPEMSVANV